MPVRLLLADAEPGFTDLYRRALARDGFEVAIAHTSLDCLARLRTFRPDVLILDPELPWGQGQGLLARLSEEPDVLQLPVILLCAAYRPEYRKALVDFAAAECYQKPVSPGQLADRLRILLGCLSSQQATADPEGDSPAEQADLPGHPQPADGRLRVLIVDDEHDTADTMRMLLERAGHEAEVAYSGRAALEAARRLRPDVVLCDLGLPGLDGLGVAAALRADPLTAGARLIAVSGYGQEDDVRRSLEAGFELHLTKPVNPTDWPRLLANKPGERGASAP
jgi:DNA-binding response OmpR family regulator